MKKVLMLLTVVTLLTATSKAQTGFAILAGVNWQNINGEDENGDKLNFDMATKFHVGILADVPIATDFYFQPGLVFRTKGAKYEETVLGEKLKAKVNMGYIDIPLSLVYKPEVGAGHVILGFGPYVGFGLMGKSKFEGGGINEEQDIKFKSDVKPSDPDDVIYFKRLDAGANIFAGYEFTPNIFVQLGAQLGLVDINPKYDGQKPDGKAKHTGFGLSLGYRF
ncbi:MAG TPA: porin family protein [Flavitalea sp.]|nr:porin family protein [Flavitalea sp.]